MNHRGPWSSNVPEISVSRQHQCYMSALPAGSLLGSEARTTISVRTMTRMIWMGTRRMGDGCAGDVGEGDGAWGLGAREDIGWDPRDASRIVVYFTAFITPTSLHRVLRPSYPAAPAPALATPECHPGPPTPPPPVYALAEAAHNAHVKNMRTLLLPVFKNLVRRFIVECTLDAADADAAVEAGLSTSRKPLDPAMRAARMSLGRRGGTREDQERGRGRGNENTARRGATARLRGRRGRAIRAPCSRLRRSGRRRVRPAWEREHVERQRKEKRAAARVEERKIKPTIPVSPVLNSPRLLRPIPYVPETIAPLLSYSLDAIKMSGAKLACHYITAGAPSANARWWRSRRRRTEMREDMETRRKKDSEGRPWVIHIPAEDETTAGAERHEARRGRRHVEEDEGPGTWEREMELVDEMATGRLKTPCSAEGAFGWTGDCLWRRRSPQATLAAFPRAGIAVLELNGLYQVVPAVRDPNSPSIGGTLTT
ncbi:hypothetical protein B0H14DRAFT_3636847 [Mycena olivaceomarginata]|nr:hypothetical protein B0H14DRAFT_3636847 [Mycena olivaceomarginata]